jgi:hypothetical protein
MTLLFTYISFIVLFVVQIPMISGGVVLDSQNIFLPRGMWWQAGSSGREPGRGDEKTIGEI